MPDRLANKIAAGEVVQRPASVAKELIENALDAGASSVDLVVKDAGSTLVQVVDDGSGMHPDDAERAFQRHATSKIHSVDDLERIRTLGFRGEALASIAAVAQVDLKTKRVEDESGYRVRVEGGEQVAAEPCAASNGTSVAVRNLFYNVPARRNFLKTPATEFRHITETFQFLALSNPAVAFTLQHNGNTVYELQAAPDVYEFEEALRQRIIGLLGTNYEGHLLPVEASSSYLSVHGYIGDLDLHRKSRREQFLFVNGRYVENRYLSHAVRAAYDELLPENTFPFFALFLELDPRRVDVNVHPTKAEVKFDDKSGIYGFLRSTAQDALRTHTVTPQWEQPEQGGEQEKSTDGPEASSDGRASPPSPRPFRPRGREQSDREKNASSGASSDTSSSRPRPSPSDASSSSRVSPGEQSEELYRPPESVPSGEEDEADASEDAGMGAEEPGPLLGTLDDTYLVVASEEGLLLVDQQAAHERVLYEQAVQGLEEEQADTQQLLFPKTIELDPADAELFEEMKPALQRLGFEVEALSGRTVAVRGVPTSTADGQETDLLEDLIERYKARKKKTAKNHQHLAQSLAEKNAVRRGQSLSAAERRALLVDLWDCEMPYANPRGQATMTTLTPEEIDKRLDR